MLVVSPLVGACEAVSTNCGASKATPVAKIANGDSCDRWQLC